MSQRCVYFICFRKLSCCLTSRNHIQSTTAVLAIPRLTKRSSCETNQPSNCWLSWCSGYPKKNQIIFKSDIISQSDLIASSPGYDVKLDCSMWFFFRGAWHFCIHVSTCLYVKPKERYKTETVLSVQTSSSSNLPTLALARTNVNLPHLRTYEILKSSTYWIIEHRIHFSCFDTQRYLVDRAELRQPAPSNQHSNVFLRPKELSTTYQRITFPCLQGIFITDNELRIKELAPAR